MSRTDDEVPINRAMVASDMLTGDMLKGGRLASTVARDMARLLAEPLPPGLYIVATPIGNLADITLRALAVLTLAEIVYCEDTRHSSKLLQHFSIPAITRPLHDHNEERAVARILHELEAGKRIALISDAGTPLISDPGFKVVRECAAAGHCVICIPGPSSAIAAMAVSGLATDAFFFAGFLPVKQSARQTRLKELAAVPGSLIFFESAQRLGESLEYMAHVLGPRQAVMARELTKLHEEVARGTLASLAESMKNREVKGEIVIVVGPAQAAQASDKEIAAHLELALRSMSLKDAAKSVSEVLGVAKTRVYDLGLKIKNLS